jgi:hypothetical protein
MILKYSIPTPYIFLLSKKYFGFWDLGVGLRFMITFFISSYHYLVHGLSIFESGGTTPQKKEEIIIEIVVTLKKIKYSIFSNHVLLVKFTSVRTS